MYDHDSLVALEKERAEVIRESWVKLMESRILREELRKCAFSEGVNRYSKCRHLIEAYHASLKNRVTGGFGVGLKPGEKK